ncbi:MAG: response regulator transcription factor [bacterium]|nr:response regulator transcription factor [bacterium]
MTRRVLVVEDDVDLSRLVRLQLEDLGCAVDCVVDGDTGLATARAHVYDLVILDLGLPGLGGIDLCRALREEPRYTPILMLTAKSTEFDRVYGLEAGADDYLTKPFSVLELVARVKAAFRRADGLRSLAPLAPDQVADDPYSRPLRRGGLELDASRRAVTLDLAPVELTAKEFDLLHYFAAHPGRVFSRVQLLDQVWGYGHDGYEHTVNSHINRLRSKIERDPRHPEFILTVWGVGYKFNDMPPGSAASAAVREVS